MQRAELRAVDDLSKNLTAASFGFFRQVPGSTLWDLILKLDPAAFREVLVEQVRRLHRMKVFQLELPFGVVSIDGKTTAVKEEVNKYCQRQSGGYWLYQVLNATSISTPLSPLIMQLPINRQTMSLGCCPR